MIKTYPDRAAHDAAAKSEMESTVALIENVNKVVIDGVNVVTTQPKVGDIVCYDENRRLRFIELDSYREGTFPSAWETLGVVVIRHGDEVTIVSKEYSSSGVADRVYLRHVGGYVTDGEEHETSITIEGREELPFTYTANTTEEFAEALQRFLTENGLAGWKSYVLDGIIKLQRDDAESVSNLSVSSPNLTFADPISVPGIGRSDNICRRGYACNGVWNVRLAKSYFLNDMENNAYNPTKVINSFSDQPICWPAFTGTSQYRDGDKCLWLRQQYCADPAHPKIEEWEAYIDDMQIETAMRGNCAPAFADGRDATAHILRCDYLDDEGAKKKLSRVAEFAHTFMDGAGYLPSVTEYIEAFRNCYEESEDADASTPATRGLRLLGVPYSKLPGSLRNWNESISACFVDGVAFTFILGGYITLRPRFNYVNINVWAFAKINLKQI